MDECTLYILECSLSLVCHALSLVRANGCTCPMISAPIARPMLFISTHVRIVCGCLRDNESACNRQPRPCFTGLLAAHRWSAKSRKSLHQAKTRRPSGPREAAMPRDRLQPRVRTPGQPPPHPPQKRPAPLKKRPRSSSSSSSKRPRRTAM
jgi:hypothetical protein